MSKRISRREVLRSTAFAGVTACLSSRAVRAAGDAPSEKLNVACIGVGGRGRANLMAVAKEKENIVALCDVDEQRAGDIFMKFPWAKKYHDYRVMLEELSRQIDAVVVSTPDHTHAPSSVMAMKMGKHVYCEKPLTHCVHEAQVMAELAAGKKLVTQMGTQHHARTTPRRVVEIIRAGAIGAIDECHVWIGDNRGGGERPTDTPPVPPHLKWDLWLGPRPYRPYHPDYVPYKWRFWWDFGTGETGNNGCHIMDYAYWPLEFRHPLTVEAEGPPVHAETSPQWMHVRYMFAARGTHPPLTLHWYHTADGPPVLKKHNLPHCESGVLFMGKKGMLLATYGQWKLFPESTFADFTPPEPSIPASVGHHKEWLQACKTGGETTCNFDYAAPLTQIILLGNVAYRTGKRLSWDPTVLKARDCPAADPFIKEPYRQGWAL